MFNAQTLNLVANLLKQTGLGNKYHSALVTSNKITLRKFLPNNEYHDYTVEIQDIIHNNLVTHNTKTSRGKSDVSFDHELPVNLS